MLEICDNVFQTKNDVLSNWKFKKGETEISQVAHLYLDSA